MRLLHWTLVYSTHAFRVQTQLIHIILHTLSPSLPTLTSHPCHHHISTDRHPIISTLTFHMPKRKGDNTYAPNMHHTTRTHQTTLGASSSIWSFAEVIQWMFAGFGSILLDSFSQCRINWNGQFRRMRIMWFILFSFEAGILNCIQVGEDTFESGLLRIRSEDTAQHRKTTQRGVLRLHHGWLKRWTNDKKPLQNTSHGAEYHELHWDKICLSDIEDTIEFHILNNTRDIEGHHHRLEWRH